MNREQLTEAVILCGEKERKIETLQLTEPNPFPECWQPQATIWCHQALQKIQQNAVTLDGMIEAMDTTGQLFDESALPKTPVEYTRLVTLAEHKKRLETVYSQDREAKGLLQQFFYNCIVANPRMMDLLLCDPRVDPAGNNNHAIKYAAQMGVLESVDLLLSDPRVDPTDETFSTAFSGNSAYELAVRGEHLDVIKRILQEPRFHTKNILLRMLSTAVWHNSNKVVVWLLENTDIGINPNTIIQIQMAYAKSSDEIKVSITKAIESRRR